MNIHFIYLTVGCIFGIGFGTGLVIFTLNVLQLIGKLEITWLHKQKKEIEK